MSRFQDLKDLFRRRLLTAARRDLIGHFDTTISGYEEEIDRQRKLLDVVLIPEIKLRRAVFPADVQQLLVSKEEVPPEQQEWSPSLDQEDPPEPPHIKEEQEEVWTSQEGEQLQGLEEADITKFPFTPVPVKSEEDDEEKPQSSQLHQRQTEQMETEADGEDCGGPEPARNSDPDRHLQPNTDDKTEDSSEPETDDSDDWKETREPQSRLNEVKRCNTDKKPFSCSECGKRCSRKGNLKRHMRTHTGEKPFSCLECDKRFGHKTHLQIHMRCHTGEKPFSCSVCGKRFTQQVSLTRHMAIHTGEKPFSCLECDKRFGHKTHLKIHMSMHTGDKRVSCSVCDQRFTWYEQLRRHKCVGHQSSQLHQNQTEENREAEPPASSSTEQMETEADGEDCGGPEPARNSDPDRHFIYLSFILAGRTH